MGAVATTTIAGVMLARRGLGRPIGSLTQLGTIRLGKRTDERTPKISDFVPLAQLADLEFGGWDIFPDNAYESATHASVLEPRDIAPVRAELAEVAPMAGVFYPGYVRRLHGTHIKSAASKAEMVEKVQSDIRGFVDARGCSRAVMVWCGSTEVYMAPTAVHQSIAAFERGLAESAPEISNAQIYAWAAMKEGVPFANGAPNLCVDFPAAWQLARERGVPLAGKDFKTGQTLMKTVLAPMLKARMLGLRGWFSTNILGNRDGEVLDDPGSFHTKEVSKLGVIEHILQKDLYPELYGEVFHKVRIEYYE
jgi:myo-inositol-1-phosphate synthase